MMFLNEYEGLEARIVDLFSKTFTASEGLDEGHIIGDLVCRLLNNTPKQDIYTFIAEDEGEIVGGAIFSRLIYSDDPRSVFILSPMAVISERQGQGIGQAFLRHALTQLRGSGVDVAITYGDPAFYEQVGFLPLEVNKAASPLPLSFPEGWVGQSLGENELLPLQGACSCVAALNDPAIW